jgi:hypothetical protein
VCLFDPDQADKEDPSKRVFVLPGSTYPEADIFDWVLETLDTAAARLTVSMQLPPDAQERVKEVVRSRALTNRDRHVIYEQIGEDLDFTAGAVVASAFLAVWAQMYPEKVEALIAPFADLVPPRPTPTA